jgi:exoribonuclease-2
VLKPTLNALVWYKGRPARIVELGEKITIEALAGKGTETIKVRDKDIEVLHPGPVGNLADFTDAADNPPDLQGAWELIESGTAAVNLKELTELAYGDFNPQNAWNARLLVAEGLYFTGTADAVSARSAREISDATEKRRDKAKEGQEREDFIARLRKGAFDPAQDSRFMQDVEALAYGNTAKSRTLKELGRTETPQEAHRLLLTTGFWDTWTNPHPQRFGITAGTYAPAGAESYDSKNDSALQRRDLTHLLSFAIDSPWSGDPDDALSFETLEGRRVLYVHVADPASKIARDSALDIAARARGATLYLPEGVRHMLGDDAVDRFALGLTDNPDNALSFKITLNNDGSIEETEIVPSIVNVTRLSYEEADRLVETSGDTKGEILKELFAVADQNLERRLNAGAVSIQFPETHITVKEKKIEILPIVFYRSAAMVRECMLLAGEGAADWAARRRLAFPYITQEGGDLPAKPLPGLAGSVQLRRCMRPRAVSAKPGYHWGLGLDGYSQVTSPLRRYTDFLAHQQIHALLGKEAHGANGLELLNEEELLFRLAAADAAAQAVTHAERASRVHWTAVYLDSLLAAGTDMCWEAVITEKKSNGLGVIIPALALETQIGAQGQLQPNDTVKLRIKSVRMPELEMNFVCST